MSKKKLCTLCKNDENLKDTPREAVGLFTGLYYNQHERLMPIRAWMCDFHADQMEVGSFSYFSMPSHQTAVKEN
jgi:hypothetical protein